MDFSLENKKFNIYGPDGNITMNCEDEIIQKFIMLYKGECEGFGVTAAAEKFGYSRQRYYQLLQQFKNQGALGLKKEKTGPKGQYRRTKEVERQIIRYRFLNPDTSAEVIAQKLQQCGHNISIRSVNRVISQFGLLKKTSIDTTLKKSH